MVYMFYIALIFAYVQYIMLYIQQIDRMYTYRIPAVGCATAKDSKLQHYVRCYLQTLAEAEFVFWNYGGRCC